MIALAALVFWAALAVIVGVLALAVLPVFAWLLDRPLYEDAPAQMGSVGRAALRSNGSRERDEH